MKQLKKIHADKNRLQKFNNKPTYPGKQGERLINRNEEAAYRGELVLRFSPNFPDGPLVKNVTYGKPEQ